MKVYEGMSWREFLESALCEYKTAHPDTPMTDRKILESIMDHLAESGIAKRKGGQYVVPSRIGRLK